MADISDSRAAFSDHLEYHTMQHRHRAQLQLSASAAQAARASGILDGIALLESHGHTGTPMSPHPNGNTQE